MKLDPAGTCHLTYCTNIHAGESWAEVRENLELYLTAVRRRVAPDEDFGVGLRLSAAAAEDLTAPDRLAEFQEFLAANRLYVFTLNGFPYGPFHGRPVKERVYQPDWRAPERLDYSNRLADILAHLLPHEADLEGTISTVPGGFKADIESPADVAAMVDNMVRHVGHLVALQKRTGKTISLALEPEPCCFIETIDEAVDFFSHQLFAPATVDRLAEIAGLDRQQAGAALRRHLGLCLDLCHAAVEFEDAPAAIAKLRRAGIRVGKMQISAGLRCAAVDAATCELLRPFDDEVYLHQVVARSGGRLERYVDLAQAFAVPLAADGESEWRVHFHVPIFLDDLGDFASTQDFVRQALALHREQAISPHLEVETYTWDVLPPAYRNVDVVSAIARELDWVRRELSS
jgi:hypothetical protein